MLKVLKFSFPYPVILLCMADLGIMYLSISTGLSLSYATSDVFFGPLSESFGLERGIFISLTFISLITVGVYSRQFLTDMKMSLLAIGVGHGFALGYMAIIFYILKDIEIWRSALLPALGISAAGVFVAHFIFDRLASVRLFRRRVLILGNGALAARVVEAIDRSPYLICVGCLDQGLEISAVPASLLVKPKNSLFDIAQELRAEEIVTAPSERRQQLPMDELLECRLKGLQITEFSTFIERQEAHIEIDGLQPSWIIFGARNNTGTIGQRVAKRILDVVISAAVIMLCLPLATLISLAILIESRGAILYQQDRVGINGKVFRIWKFRSMIRNAEPDGQAYWSMPKDLRVTRVGRLLRRLRLDELPQVWNVLKGDMSFVGPRPERPEFVAYLEKKIPFYGYRHAVKPGLTGWAQIHYPYGNTVGDSFEKLKYDLYYVKNYSLILDFIVLIQTLRVILWPTAATSPKVEAVPRIGPAE